MKNLMIASLFMLFCTGLVAGQSIEIDKTAQQELAKLSFIIGEWEGEGWMMGRDGTKYPFTQTENIRYKLDNTTILIEGLGKAEGEVIHNALAILRYNHAEGNYSFNSYLSTGMGGSFKAELIDDRLYWSPNENMRYIIELNEKDQWHEKGEIMRDGSWFQFLEMTLNRI